MLTPDRINNPMPSNHQASQENNGHSTFEEIKKEVLSLVREFPTDCERYYSLWFLVWSKGYHAPGATLENVSELSQQISDIHFSVCPKFKSS